MATRPRATRFMLGPAWLWGIALVAAASAQVGVTPRRGHISPSIVRLKPGGECRFRAVLEPGWLQPARALHQIRWSVNDVLGGNARLGTIDSSGRYRAPIKPAGTCEVVVCARTQATADRRMWATVLIGSKRPGYTVVRKWDEPTDGSAHMKDPVSMSWDGKGNLLIADYAKGRVFRYTPHGRYLGELGPGRQGEGPSVSFENPTCVATDAHGRVFVSDLRTGPPRIRVFRPDGALQTAFAAKGVGPGQVMLVRGMSFDSGGRLFAADAETMRVNVYTGSGRFLESWDRAGVLPGRFAEPYGLIVDANDEVVVPNFYGPCQRFTATGEFLLAFAEPDPPNGPVAYTGIAGDRWGNVYLAVRGSSGLVQNTMDPEPRPVRLVKFNSSGVLVYEQALWPDERGENPMVVDRDGRVYVAFKRGKRVGVAVLATR